MLLLPHLPPETTAGVVLAGEAPRGLSARRLLSLAAACPRPLLIGADGGADHMAALGLTPDLIVGDGDSLQGDFPAVERVVYPAHKDITDGQAALELALERTRGRVELYGALGGRLDHLLANILLPLSLAQGPERVTLLDGDMEAIYCRQSCLIQGRPGDIVSFIPLTPQVTGITLGGLEYPLDDFSAPLGSSRMVSNVMLSHQAAIELTQGLVLAIHYQR